jgi:peptidyl-dipeptidase A
MSPTHLKKLKLTENESLNYKQNINYLMKQALKKISFLPFGYLMDKWRWAVFRGEINETNYNQKWWEMRYSFLILLNPP